MVSVLTEHGPWGLSGKGKWHRARRVQESVNHVEFVQWFCRGKSVNPEWTDDPMPPVGADLCGGCVARFDREGKA